MTFNPALLNPTQLCLEIDATLQTQLWHHSQSFATPTSRWTAYLNQLCLQTLLPWFQEDYPQAKVVPTVSALAPIWEVVNGTAITIGSLRLVLLPIETTDLDEIRIPQEWVDVPRWAADFYIAVQVNPDEQWVRVAGFTTHQQVKRQGRYEWGDRTYALDETDLNPDLNALWVAHRLNPHESTRLAVAPLSPLPVAQADHLLHRLGQPEVLTPRLEIPFETWAAFIQHDGWRQRLTDLRRGSSDSGSVLQWVQSGLSTLASQMGWERVRFQPAMEGARSDSVVVPTWGVSKPLMLVGQPYELRVLPLEDSSSNTWRFELRALTVGGQIPPGTTLRLLTEDLQSFDHNEDRAMHSTDLLSIDVELEPGEGLVWEIDPTPEDYVQEILRF